MIHSQNYQKFSYSPGFIALCKCLSGKLHLQTTYASISWYFLKIFRNFPVFAWIYWTLQATNGKAAPSADLGQYFMILSQSFQNFSGFCSDFLDFTNAYWEKCTLSRLRPVFHDTFSKLSEIFQFLLGFLDFACAYWENCTFSRLKPIFHDTISKFSEFFQFLLGFIGLYNCLLGKIHLEST